MALEGWLARELEEEKEEEDKIGSRKSELVRKVARTDVAPRRERLLGLKGERKKTLLL